jgi:hypothetical protein
MSKLRPGAIVRTKKAEAEYIPAGALGVLVREGPEDWVLCHWFDNVMYRTGESDHWYTRKHNLTIVGHVDE